MRILTLVPALVLLFAAPRIHAAAQIDWAGFDGGGGASQSGQIAHRGTIGGWVRQTIQSANYSILPGSPHEPATEENTELPTLRIVRVGDTVRISWPAWATAFVLEGNPAMVDGSAWNEVPGPVQPDGEEVFVLVPTSEACLFYRLRSD